ncbi:secreted RxLR effector protein 161-like [Trifolium pratense]|uniref:secreted RxLR effector protein 161-like n=1 Tax=Trifolium pratense TaxID=57577 RepID=UPI001E694A86|nr:secreted RxLR effector protein 161-like [Trifolium pratense]
MVGCLMYLLATRPDLAYSVCLVARFMDKPTEAHVAAVKRIMRYLKGTLSFGLVYKSKCKTDMKLEGYCDSDYVGDLDDRKSTTGFVFMLGSGAISWSSKKQGRSRQFGGPAPNIKNRSLNKKNRSTII